LQFHWKFSDSNVRILAGCIGDVTFVEQKLELVCGELDERKADKDLLRNALNAVSLRIQISGSANFLQVGKHYANSW